MVEVSMEDDKMGDGFKWNIELIEMAKKRVGNCANSTFDHSIRFPSYQVEVEKLASEKSDMLSNLIR